MSVLTGLKVLVGEQSASEDGGGRWQCVCVCVVRDRIPNEQEMRAELPEVKQYWGKNQLICLHFQWKKGSSTTKSGIKTETEFYI